MSIFYIHFTIKINALSKFEFCFEIRFASTDYFVTEIKNYFNSFIMAKRKKIKYFVPVSLYYSLKNRFYDVFLCDETYYSVVFTRIMIKTKS